MKHRNMRNRLGCPGGILHHTTDCRYLYLSSTEHIIRGRKGTGGIHLVRTGQAIILSCYVEPTTPEQCAVVTEKLGDYLVGQGF